MALNYNSTDETTPTSTKRLLIAILSTIALADFGLGLNTVVLPLYAKHLGASIITIGLIIASFGLARILVNIPISIISSRLKTQYIHIGIFFIFIGAVGYFLSTTYYQLFIFRFLEGFGSGIINTSSMLILTKHLYQDKKRGKILSIYMIARRISMGSAPFLGAVIAFEFSDKSTFLLYAIIIFIALIVAFYNKKFLNNIKTPEIAVKCKPNKNPHKTENKGYLKKYSALLYNPGFIVLCILTFSFFFARIGSRRELVPLVGVDIMNLNKANIGLLISISALIGIVLTYYSDKVINVIGIKKSIIISFIISAIGILGFIIFKNLFAFGASIILLSAGGGFSGPARNLYLMDNVDKNHYNEAIGIYRTLGDLGFILGPVAVGAVLYYKGYILAYGLVVAVIIATTVIFSISAKSESKKPLVPLDSA